MPGEQVVGQGVAGEALDQRQHRQLRADEPVELTRLAERPGEEHAHHVHVDRHDEQQCCPVVDLADDEAAADVEGDVKGRGVGLGHHDAPERDVGAVVLHLARAGHEPEGQERTGQQADDHGVHGHLTEHEGPVVGEDLLHEVADALGRPSAVVDPAGDPADLLHASAYRGLGLGVVGAQAVCARGGVSVVLIHAPRSSGDRLAERCVGHQVTLGVNSDLQLRKRTLRRAEDDLAVLRHVEGRLVTRAQQVVGLLLVEADGAAHVQILE